VEHAAWKAFIFPVPYFQVSDGLSKKFEILRAMVFVLLLTMTLAFVPVAHGDVQTALIVSVGTFTLSIVVAAILMFIFRL
jgi:Na+-driven multidrug efflux pump